MQLSRRQADLVKLQRKECLERCGEAGIGVRAVEELLEEERRETVEHVQRLRLFLSDHRETTHQHAHLAKVGRAEGLARGFGFEHERFERTLQLVAHALVCDLDFVVQRGGALLRKQRPPRSRASLQAGLIGLLHAYALERAEYSFEYVVVEAPFKVACALVSCSCSTSARTERSCSG